MKNVGWMSVLIVSMILMISGLTLGSNLGTPGMHPGTGALTSGEKSRYFDSSFRSQSIVSDQLELALSRMPVRRTGLELDSKTLSLRQTGSADRSAYRAGIYASGQEQTTPTYSTVSSTVSNRNLLRSLPIPSMCLSRHPTIRLGRIFHPPTIIIP